MNGDLNRCVRLLVVRNVNVTCKQTLAAMSRGELVITVIAKSLGASLVHLGW
jgi:hypothetical protein